MTNICTNKFIVSFKIGKKLICIGIGSEFTNEILKTVFKVVTKKRSTCHRDNFLAINVTKYNLLLS